MQYVDLTKTVEKHQQEKVLKEKKAGEKPRKMKFIKIFVALLIIGLAVVFRNNLATVFSPVSIVSNITNPNLKSSDGRTNILVLGKDERSSGNETSILTDSLLFASISNNEGSVAMISLPRDLWVKANGGTEHFLKINAVYTVDGVDELLHITEEVLGMPIHYYVVVDFNLFKDSIDALGGVEVDVEQAFVDYEYPIEGKEADVCGRTTEEVEKMKDYAPYIVFPCRYETISFEVGKQIMDGDTALKYVRSRHGSNNEGTDFARSHRQQKVIMAIKDKVLNIKTILNLAKVKDLYDAYANNVDTNLNFEDVQGFWILSQKIKFDSVRSIVLDDRSGAEEGGLLYSPTDTSLYGGAYVLLPKAGNYSQIRAYVQRYIFGE